MNILEKEPGKKLFNMFPDNSEGARVIGVKKFFSCILEIPACCMQFFNPIL